MNTQAAGAAYPMRGPLDFDQAEYQARTRAIQSVMELRGAEMLLVDQIDHLAYLFGYLATAARYQAALIPVQGEPWLIVRELDLGTFLDQSWSRSYETFADDEDSHARVTSAIARLAPKSLAIEKDSNILTVARLNQIRAGNPGMEIVDFSGVIWQHRLIKSPAELAYIRRAAEIADHVVTAGAGAIKAGVSDRDSLAAMYEASIRHGADNSRAAILGRMTGVDALIGGVTGALWAHGERVFVEATPQYRGYSARLVRPVIVGKTAAADAELARQMIAIQDCQIAAMVPGAKGGDVDAICRGEVLRQGLKTVFTQITGYTLGYQAVPRVSDHTRIMAPGQTWSFKPHMVFHVVLHTPQLAFSETVVVTETGPERLSRLPRALLSE
ncbi:MAG: aminopeptidase P family protein [Mesorhizobium sp.]|nr:MAG: aminopeptidase P family protein [Mesorhizobium sp.]TIW28628.1 MAG: aminopeptidase P family protein [Mesorhizobium sp.]